MENASLIGNKDAQVRLDGFQGELKIKRDNKYYTNENVDGYSEMRTKAGAVKTRKLDQQALAAIADALEDDGRVDLKEAQNILKFFSDGRWGKSEFTCNERWTLRYAIAEFEWDQNAHDFILTETRNIPNIINLDDKTITSQNDLNAVFWGPTDEELGLHAEAQFPTGSKVSVVGLVKCPEFNGQQGKVISYDKDMDRYEVRFADGGVRRVKTANISSNTGGEPKAKKAKTDNGLIFVDGMLLDKDVLIACRRALKQGPKTESGSRIIDALEAVEVLKAMTDDGVITRTERWTLRFCLASYPFTRAAHHFLVEALGRDKFAHSDKKGA